MKYSKCRLELANSSSMRIDSHSTSSAGVNQHNPIETKGATSIYEHQKIWFGGIQKQTQQKNQEELLQGMCFSILQGNFGFLSLKMYLFILLLWELLTKLSYIAVHLVSGFTPTTIQFWGSLAD